VRTLTGLVIVIAFASNCLANADSSLVGTWILWNPRTVIGTGATNTVIKITRVSNAYHVGYSFGEISVVKDDQGNQVYKTVTTTYFPIPIAKIDGVWSFSVPGQREPVRLELKSFKGNEVLVPVGMDFSKGGPAGIGFYKEKD
jgi:hypothetical protein